MSHESGGQEHEEVPPPPPQDNYLSLAETAAAQDLWPAIGATAMAGATEADVTSAAPSVEQREPTDATQQATHLTPAEIATAQELWPAIDATAMAGATEADVSSAPPPAEHGGPADPTPPEASGALWQGVPETVPEALPEEEQAVEELEQAPEAPEQALVAEPPSVSEPVDDATIPPGGDSTHQVADDDTAQVADDDVTTPTDGDAAAAVPESDFSVDQAEFAGAAFKTDAGSAFYYPDDEVFRDAAGDVPVYPGEYALDLHGGSDAVALKGEDTDRVLDPHDFAEVVRISTDWDGEPIRLFSCDTGSTPDGMGQGLADELDVPVTAPDDIVSTWSSPGSGTAEVSVGHFEPEFDPASGELRQVFHPGQWVTFEPCHGATDKQRSDRR